MTDAASNLRQVLAQTEAVAKVQEKAKRRGEVQQQQVARYVSDKVDIQGMQVEEMPESESEHKVNEDEQGKGQPGQQDQAGDEEAVEEPSPEEGKAATEEAESAAAAEIDLTCEEEGKGRLLDRKA